MRADGQHVGDVDVVVELDHLLDARLDEVQPLHVDRRAGGAVAVEVDGAGHAAHQVVGVRVLAAEDGVHLDPFLLQVQRLQVVGHGHQVGLGRQHIGLAAPVAVHEGAELAAFDELLQPVLDVAEVARRATAGAQGDTSCCSSLVFFGSAFSADTTSTQSSACRW